MEQTENIEERKNSGKTAFDLKYLSKILKYFEMRAFLNGQMNLTAGFRFVQLIVQVMKQQQTEDQQKNKSIKPIEDTFNKLKEELINSGWK